MADGLALHDIAITNIVWSMACKGRVDGGAYIAQWPCNSIARDVASLCLHVSGSRGFYYYYYYYYYFFYYYYYY